MLHSVLLSFPVEIATSIFLLLTQMNGQDYPIGFVRWTENRNIQSFMQLQAEGKLNVKSLTTHIFEFDKSPEAYDLISGESGTFYVGIVLEFDVCETRLTEARVNTMQVKESPVGQALGLGVIGAGNFARTMLLPHLKGNGVNLISVAAATGISARDTARKFGFGSCTTEYGELIRANDIDAILCATRHDLHGKVVSDGLRAGKHVYTEKPLCLDETELSEITEAYRAMAEGSDSRLLMVGFNRRFAPLVKKMKAFFGSRMEPMVAHYRINAGFIEKNN